MLHRLLLQWYRRYKRDFPWRRTRDPYAIMVSEFMLQQTQTARVAEKLPLWLEQFPDLQTLARASKRQVLLAWSGMGYNRRALNLHASAEAIVQDHKGMVPADESALLKLPGFGRYTASAVACFGHRKRVEVVDVNIRRIFSRLTEEMRTETDMLPEKRAWEIAAIMLPQRSYYNWNQALMDLGALVCTAIRPACPQCPLLNHCLSAGNMLPAERKKDSVAREIPRRIYRGNIVEDLRNASGHSAGFAELGAFLDPGFDETRHEWLLDILRTLERDSLIDAFHGRKRISLDAYQGGPASLRIRLVE